MYANRRDGVEATRRRLDRIYRVVNDVLFLALILLFLGFVVGLGFKVAPVF